MIGASGGARLGKVLDGQVLLAAFAVMMVIVAGLMLRRREPDEDRRCASDARTRRRWYLINDPVMHSLFMAPRDALWMRDGIINMLAGNLRGDPRAVLPILSFKTLFNTFSTFHRLGWGPAMLEAAR